MNLAIVGCRDYDDETFIYESIDKFLKENSVVKNELAIVSGGARGVDTIAEEYADKNNIQKIIFPAEWSTYGKQAGFIRNYKIVDHADHVLAFWNGVSKGTNHTIELAKHKGIPINVIRI